MPRIFDNIEQHLIHALRETLEISNKSDFCVGYFNLRGWKLLDSRIEQWAGGPGSCCRLLVGIQRLPQDELRTVLGLTKREGGVDNQTALRLKKKLAEEFREQLASLRMKMKQGCGDLLCRFAQKKSSSSFFCAIPSMPNYISFIAPTPIIPPPPFWGVVI